MTKRESTDVILIGAGIMSATLGTLMKELAPEWDITVFEKLDKAGEESSHELNNAGTGHAALCELNYTTEKPDGTIDMTKANNVNEQFQVSLQFWSYLVKRGLLSEPEKFIRALPHISLVQGENNVEFLRKRYEEMKTNPLFEDIEYTENPAKLAEWMPLVMNDRILEDGIAATKIDSGTDVNFGALTRKLFEHLEETGANVQYNHEVEDLKRKKNGWEVKVKNCATGKTECHFAKFVFIGGGGGSLHLLQKTGIPESKHIGGFPVSGIFMACNNPEVVEQHHAKVYGKAKVGAPPMSVPHLDTRFINNEKQLLFGPYAGFSPKFLKTGSNMDLITSVKPSNVFTMLAAGAKELPLTKYLVTQVIQSKEQRMKELREFIPNAKSEDWDLIVAGQRVQVIKDTDHGGKGTLQFGTEVITGADGTVAALLGASPGASTAVHVMLDILNRCFPDQMEEWEPKIKEMVPSFGQLLRENPDLLREVKETTSEVLKLHNDTEEQKLLASV
ncbi:malate dehydrogenase (quinone) [Oceanobacillus luteolus]|uniref:Probable malate:quinone oxidoreductase n=1 Tax=Oceanobacillus luteolus TaxID=1274358 RepID=A0ABW4HL36_9BACI